MKIPSGPDKVPPPATIINALFFFLPLLSLSLFSLYYKWIRIREPVYSSAITVSIPPFARRTFSSPQVHPLQVEDGRFAYRKRAILSNRELSRYSRDALEFVTPFALTFTPSFSIKNGRRRSMPPAEYPRNSDTRANVSVARVFQLYFHKRRIPPLRGRFLPFPSCRVASPTRR